jgi:hypothetical protein
MFETWLKQQHDSFKIHSCPDHDILLLAMSDATI